MRNKLQCLSWVSSGGSIASHPVLNGPAMAYLGSQVVLRCSASNSSLPVTYELRKDGLLIDARAHLQEVQPVSFSLKVTVRSGGLYHCETKTDGSVGISNSIRFNVVSEYQAKRCSIKLMYNNYYNESSTTNASFAAPASNTRVNSDPFPAVLYEGSRMVLRCDAAKGSHLSYSWFFNKKQVTSATSPRLHITGNKIVMERATPEHTGAYSCIAWSRVQDVQWFSSSSEVKVIVKGIEYSWNDTFNTIEMPEWNL